MLTVEKYKEHSISASEVWTQQ